MTPRAGDSYNRFIPDPAQTPPTTSAPGVVSPPRPAAEAEAFVQSLGEYVRTQRPAQMTRTSDLISDFKLTDKFDYEITRTTKPGPVGRLIQAALTRLLGKVQLFMLKSLATQERLNFYMFDRIAVLEDRIAKLERQLRREDS